MTGREAYRRRGALVALLGLFFIAAATLLPLPQQTVASAATPLWCLVCGDYGRVDVVHNIFLFIPLALGLRVLGLRTTTVWVGGTAISLIVESLQLAVIPGRDASLSDLLTNSLGSWIGAATGTALASLLSPTRKQAIRLAAGGAALWLGLLIGTGLLLRPWIPQEPLRGEWERRVHGRPGFDGKVIQAALGGTSVPSGWAPRNAELTRKRWAGDIHLELGLRSGENATRWAPVFELRGTHGSVLSVEAVGRDLTFQPPVRAYSLRLRRPALGLPHALPARPGTMVQLSAGRRHETLWASWTTETARGSSMLALSPSFGWSLLIPFGYAYGRELRGVTGVWIAGLLAPIAYWSGRSKPGRARLLIALLLLLLAGLGIVPLLLGYPPVHWSEWLGGMAGFGIGWAGHRSAAYFEERCDPPSIKESC